MKRKEGGAKVFEIRELKIRRKKNQLLVWTLAIVGFILARFIAGHLILPESICFADTSGPSLSVSISHSWENEGQLVSEPVIVENRLYLYTFIQDTFIQGQQFQLWRGDPNGPDLIWEQINLARGIGGGGISDREATALGSHKDHLYVATNGGVPHLWWREDPNQGDWNLVTPPGISSGKITALSSFDGYLYMGVTGENSGGQVQLWRSTEAASSQEVTSNTWKQIGENYSGRISCGFQEAERNGDPYLYLGVENANNRAEVWSLGCSATGRSIYSEVGNDSMNRSVADMAFSDNILYAVILNTLSNAQGGNAQVWSLARSENTFTHISAWDESIDPNQSAYLPMESLGSYLFLGSNFLGSNNTDAKTEIWQAYYDQNREDQKQWKKVSIHDKDKSTGQDITDASNRLRWLYADQDNGYLYYLGIDDPNQRITLWRSGKLPIITINSPPLPEISPQTDRIYPYTYLGAFHSKDQERVSWKSTKSGNYRVSLIRLTDPNGKTIHSPNFSDPNYNNKVEVEESTVNSTPFPATKQQGIHIGEIAWDTTDSNQSTAPNQSTASEDGERYPVLFSFIYDTEPPGTPEVTLVAPRSKKLDVQWNAVSDKLSGVVRYLIQWKEVTPEADANNVKGTNFTNSKERPVKKEDGASIIDAIEGLDNGQRYVVAVSAIDAAGNSSAQSEITDASFGTPKSGLGVTDLVGESGGCFLETVRKCRIIFRRRE